MNAGSAPEPARLYAALVPAVRAEWSKLWSTRSFLWTSVLALLVGIGYAVVLGIARGASEFGQPVYIDNWMALGGIVGGQGVPGVGLLVFMILAALSVTGEYRTGLIQLTYAAVPHRYCVLLAKALVSAVASAIAALVLTVAAEYALKFSSPADGERMGFGGDLHPLYVVPMVVAFAVVFAVGLGAIIRNSAGVIALILVWGSGIENLAFIAGTGTGNTVRRALPFSNVQNVVTNGNGALAWPYPTLSLLVFIAWTAAIALLGVLVATWRDV